MSESVEDLRKELEQKSSDELISILRNRDEDEWRPEVFEVVAQMLKDRGVAPEDVVAMGPEGTDVVESEPTVTIARFFSPAEAHISRMALEEAGLAAWVADEAGGTMYGVGIGTRLQVRAKDEAAAREVLAAAPISSEALPPDLAEPPCRACSSRNVAPQSRPDEEGPQKWFYVCADCGESWPV
jgi:putative signal transducing protein